MLLDSFHIFSENCKASLEFSELMYSLLSRPIIFGQFLCSLKFSSDVIIPKAAKSFRERSSGTYMNLMNDNSTG